ATRDLVRRYIEPLRRSGADVLALGCTHYAFLREMIQEEAGEGIAVIEPSEAVARQIQRLLLEHSLLRPAGAPGGVRYLTSGDPGAFESTRSALRAAGADIPEPAEVARQP